MASPLDPAPTGTPPRAPGGAAPPPPTLWLLPGMACDEALWQYTLPALQAAHPGPVRVADVHQHAPSLPAMVQRLLDQTEGPLLLAGCSLGGMLAMWTALAAPERVRGIAVLGSSARPDTPDLIALRTQACALFEQGRMEEVLRVNAAFAFDTAHVRRHVEAYVAMVVRGGAESLVRQNRAVMAREDLRPHLPRIACPTLVLGGQSDQLTPPECSREVAAAIPGAELVLLPQCGHMIAWEQPEALSTHLLRWLARCTAAR